LSRVLNEYSNSIFLKQNYIQKKFYSIFSTYFYSELLLFRLYTVSRTLCVCVRACVRACVHVYIKGKYKRLKRKTDRRFPLCRTFALIFAALGFFISTYSALNFYAVFLHFIIRHILNVIMLKDTRFYFLYILYVHFNRRILFTFVIVLKLKNY